MYKRRIFTVDPDYFPLARMREIVNYLHAHKQRYGELFSIHPSPNFFKWIICTGKTKYWGGRCPITIRETARCRCWTVQYRSWIVRWLCDWCQRMASAFDIPCFNRRTCKNDSLRQMTFWAPTLNTLPFCSCNGAPSRDSFAPAINWFNYHLTNKMQKTWKVSS